jgi:nicotinamide mononucleotide transporter
MSIIEIIAITFTLACVYLTSKQSIWCWPTAIVSVIAFFLIYIQEELYVNSGLQIVFLVQSIYGWYVWHRGKDDHTLPVTLLGLVKVAPLTRGAILIPLLLVLIFVDVPTLPDYLDAVSTGLALLATWFLIHKKLEAWIIWMVVNCMLFTLMMIQGVYVIAGLEVVLFIISLNAFKSWKKSMTTGSV